jgi:hypothetical protein
MLVVMVFFALLWLFGWVIYDFMWCVCFFSVCCCGGTLTCTTTSCDLCGLVCFCFGLCLGLLVGCAGCHKLFFLTAQTCREVHGCSQGQKICRRSKRRTRRRLLWAVRRGFSEESAEAQAKKGLQTLREPSRDIEGVLRGAICATIARF